MSFLRYIIVCRRLLKTQAHLPFQFLLTFVTKENCEVNIFFKKGKIFLTKL